LQGVIGDSRKTSPDWFFTVLCFFNNNNLYILALKKKSMAGIGSLIILILLLSVAYFLLKIVFKTGGFVIKVVLGIIGILWLIAVLKGLA
jgi:hypothetical protein